MAAKRKTKKARPLSRQQLLERDPWHFQRQDDPVFLAILNVLIDHPTVTYYSCDWRPWLEGRRTGKMTPNPDPACGSMHVPYNEVVKPTKKHPFHRHGGGYLERFANGVIAMLVGITVTLPDGT